MGNTLDIWMKTVITLYRCGSYESSTQEKNQRGSQKRIRQDLMTLIWMRYIITLFGMSHMMTVIGMKISVIESITVTCTETSKSVHFAIRQANQGTDQGIV